MKKHFIIPLLVVITLILTGCGVDTLSIVTSNISESREKFFVGECDLYYTTFVSGTREDPYLIDGIHSNNVSFGIITFQAKSNTKLTAENLSYDIIVDEIVYTGELISSPIDHTYAADIQELAKSDEDINITIYIDDTTQEFVLNLVSDDFAITQENAIKIAVNSLESSINQMIEDSGSIECYVKIWKDFSGDEKSYFWYISVISFDKTVSILINTYTGDIVSIKN